MKKKALVWSTALAMMIPICGQAENKASVIINADKRTQYKNGHLTVNLPAKSVITLELK